jgi:hypothetical protein
VARAKTSWNSTMARCQRAKASVASSRWLLTSSRAVLDRRRPLFRGAADWPRLDRIRVLVVEDNETTRYAWSRYLTECGAIVRAGRHRQGSPSGTRRGHLRYPRDRSRSARPGRLPAAGASALDGAADACACADGLRCPRASGARVPTGLLRVPGQAGRPRLPGSGDRTTRAPRLITGPPLLLDPGQGEEQPRR